MTRGGDVRIQKVLRWVVILVVDALGAFAGLGAALDYYRHHHGNWQIGVTAVAIGVGITLGVALIVFVVGRVVRSEEAMARSRRTVIHSVALLLTAGGALGGVGAGYSYASDNAGRWVEAVFVGIGTALGAWLAAAVLGLLVEIANSLRQLTRPAQPSVPPLGTTACGEPEATGSPLPGV